MKHLLSLAHVEELVQFASGSVLLAFDFDGTLAPIVAHRDLAKMRARTDALFKTVCQAYPCAVITGRGRAEVVSRLNGASVKYVVGNHGLESGRGLAKFERAMVEPRKIVKAMLADVPGVDVEDKKYSLTLHYRGARQKRAAQQAIAQLPKSVRVISGKDVFNVVPVAAPHKGDALRDLCARAGVEKAVYVGDDVTDEDVFGLAVPQRLLSVRVGRAASSAADYYLRDQQEVDVFLDILVKQSESQFSR